MGQNLPVGATAQASAPTGCASGAPGRAPSRARARSASPTSTGSATKVDDAKRRGIKTLVVIGRTPGWATGGQPAIAPPERPGALRRVHGRARAPAPRRGRVGDLERGGRPEFWLGGPHPAPTPRCSRPPTPRSRRRSRTTSWSPAARSATTWTSSSSSTRQRRAGLLRRVRRAHRHGVPDRRPGLHLPRRARPRRPLHVHRLPRGPRGDEPARRRRQADLDDRARLEHAVDRADTPAASASARAPSRSASPRRAGAFLTKAYRCLAADPFVHHRAVVRHRRTSPGSAHAAGFGLYRSDQLGQAGGGRVPRARRRDRAGAVRRRRRQQRAGDRGRQAARRREVRRHDRHQRQGRGLARRRRHRADQVVRRRQVRAHVRRRHARHLAVLGLALLEARQAHADVQGDRRGEQRHHQVGHRLQGQAAPKATSAKLALEQVGPSTVR